MGENKICYEGIAPFSLSVKYVEFAPEHPEDYPQPHVHPQCEIYINISGDVSFVVENSIYPISPGSVIITRPFEYHHCIYHRNVMHKHFWILFSPGENKPLLDLFYKRAQGMNNLLVLPPEETDELVSLCHTMVDVPMDAFDQLFSFMKCIQLLRSAATAVASPDNYSEDVRYAMGYIGEHFAENVSIRELAKQANVSLNSLERHFVKLVGMTPSAYLQKKRLANATKLLASNHSVMDACLQSGFTDYCGFIALFRRNYGITPLAYKKTLGTSMEIRNRA